jgi:DnaJ-class molecular chaperone
MQGDPYGHYAFLGVLPSASERVLRAAYRARAQELHPDRDPTPGATERFQRLEQAWAILGDAARRSAYDASSRSASAGNGAFKSGAVHEEKSSSLRKPALPRVPVWALGMVCKTPGGPLLPAVA